MFDNPKKKKIQFVPTPTGGNAPINAVAPLATGTVAVGNTLSCTNGTWISTATVTYTYQWQRNTVDIASAVFPTYTAVNADLGTNITCVVTAANRYGVASKSSNQLTSISGGGIASVYDSRYGTDLVTAAATGWFTFALHSGNKRIYVDSVNGNDSNNGLTAATAKATFNAAYTLWQSGFTAGDQLMVAGGQGQTYTESGSNSLTGKTGISAAYPTAILSYDSTDPSNSAKYGKIFGVNKPRVTITGTSLMSFTASGLADLIAVQGLYLTGNDADGPGITFQGGAHNDVIFQNCDFNDLQLTYEFGSAYDATGASYGQRGNISKCTFFGGWASLGNMQGAYIHCTKDLIIEDNVWVHNGWRVGSVRDDGDVNGGANGVNHAHYIGASNTGVVLRRNFYADTSYDGMNIRGSGSVASATNLDDAQPGQIGNFSGSFREAPDGITITVDDWLVMGGSRINSIQAAGDWFWTTNTLPGSYIRNVAALDNPRLGFLINAFDSTLATPTSITHSGTTATLTMTGHGYLTGDKISIYGAAPAEYNVSRATVTVIDANTLTFTMASTPATNATSVGQTSALVVMGLLIDKFHGYNYSGTLAGTVASTANDLTWTNTIADQLAPGVTNSQSNSGTFPGYKTRDQVITAVLTGIGITPGGSYFSRKAQFINAAMTRPDLPWSLWCQGVGLPAMGLTPTYTIPAFQTFTDTPVVVYPTSMGTLTLSTTSFTRGTGAVALINGVSSVSTVASSDLPAGFAMDVVSYFNTGTLTSGSNQITSLTTTNLTPGMYLVNPNVPRGTYIVSISGATATLSANATGSGTSNLHFEGGGRAIRYDGSGSGAATPTIHITETSQDGATTNTTAIALTIAASGVPPVLSAPTGLKTAATTATIGATTDTGSGTLYWVITTGSTPPTAARVKAGQDSAGSAAMTSGSQAISSTGAKTVNATGLTASNAPFAHFMHESASGQSNVVSTVELVGAEIANNGDFSVGTGWTVPSGASITGGQLVCSAANGFLFQNSASILSGHTYRFKFDTVAISAGSTYYPYLGTSVTQGTSRTVGSGTGTFTDTITPGSNSEYGLHFNNTTGTFDNISIKEVL